MLLNALLMAPARVLPGAVLTLHRLHPSHRATVQALAVSGAEIIHANDWMTLPSAMEESRRTGARVIYDTHEMASEEHATSWLWRLLLAPHTRAIERQFIGRANHVMTVSDGLAGALLQLYPGLVSNVTVLRNLPEQRVAEPPARINDARRLVYAGLIRPERQINVMIEALSRLDSRFTLTIIGFGSESHIAELKAAAARLGVSERVVWEEAVPPDQLVSALSHHDIGLFLMQGETAQQRYALPNKIFEYTAAGLALVAAGSDDVASLIVEYGNGIALREPSVSVLAEALAGISDAGLDAFRAASRQSSTVLNWEAEKQKLLSLYE